MAVVTVTGAHLRQQVSEGETSTAMAAPHSDLKTAARGAARLARAGADPGVGMRLAGHVLAGCAPGPGVVVAGFWPLPGEVDIRPLLLALLGRGHAVVLPETPPRGRPLVFRRWRPGVAMVAERFGTMRPVGEVAVPGLLLVPLLAFDAGCRRLGYGGGYYDRTIAGLPGVRTIGCGFARSQVDAVPVLPHDAALDAVATECGVLFRPG